MDSGHQPPYLELSSEGGKTESMLSLGGGGTSVYNQNNFVTPRSFAL